MRYEVQRWIKGWGWSTVASVPVYEQAVDMYWWWLDRGYRARIKKADQEDYVIYEGC